MIMEVRNNIFAVGVSNPTLRTFDIIMKSEYGTTYNAYVVKGEKIALIETVHEDYSDIYIENLKKVIGDKKPDYLIMNHTEPDHSGSIDTLFSIYPDLEIICTVPASKYINGITNKNFKIRTVKDGDSLDLGKDLVIDFIIAPFLHWPDSMFSHIKTRDAVFTCDFLGTHYCENIYLDTEIKHDDKYLAQMENYYECIFSPFKPYVLAGLEKLSKLNYSIVLPSHGPILTEKINYVQNKYQQWSAEKPAKAKKYIPVFHASAYGYTRELAVAAYDALINAGHDAELFDAVEAPLAKMAEAINNCDRFLIGSNTTNRDSNKPIWDIISSVDVINTGKKVGVFGSFGWSGEAVPMIVSRLLSMRFKVVGDGIKVKFRATDEDINFMKEYALLVASD